MSYGKRIRRGRIGIGMIFPNAERQIGRESRPRPGGAVRFRPAKPAHGTELVRTGRRRFFVKSRGGWAAGREGVRTLQSREAQTLSETLARCKGNIRAAASELGISRSALYGKLARFGIDYRSFRRR